MMERYNQNLIGNILNYVISMIEESSFVNSLTISPPSPGGRDREEEQVMSEVHRGCPPNHSGNELIGVSLNARRGEYYETNEDEGLILARRSDSHSLVIRIQHNITSSTPRVGLQVWKAELVLADFMLHKMFEWSNSDGIVAIELGCGTGLIGMLLAIGANTVFITDHGNEVPRNCARNIHLNSGIFHPKASVHVRELDWNSPWPPRTIPNFQSQEKLEELQRASLSLTADVIYSDELTVAFFNVLGSIMSNNPNKVLYLALEKHYNFTIDDIDAVANGYSHFLNYIKDEEEEDDLILKRNLPVLEYDRGNDV